MTTPIKGNSIMFTEWYNTFEILDTLDVNLDAVDGAKLWWYGQYGHLSPKGKGHGVQRITDYRRWMLEENGIDHSSTYIKIVDREKYMLFLLKWS